MNYAFPPHSDLFAPWRDRAACNEKAGTGDFAPNAWVDEYSLSVKAENEVCEACPVKDICLMDAILDPDAEGRRATFYFEQGKLTRAEAHRLWIEHKIKARIRNTGVSGVQESEDL